jgi:hypothetical protein
MGHSNADSGISTSSMALSEVQDFVNGFKKHLTATAWEPVVFHLFCEKRLRPVLEFKGQIWKVYLVWCKTRGA